MSGITTTSSPASSQNRLQRYFSRQLLQKVVPLLVFEQFAAKADLPRNAGARSIRFFRFKPPTTGNIQTLSAPSGTNNEGQPISPSNYRQLDSENIDVDLTQYGQVISFTDIATQVEFFNLVEQGVETNGQDAALHCDTLIRNELTVDYSSAGSNPNSDDRENKHYIYSGGAGSGGGYSSVMGPSNGTAYGRVYNSGSYDSHYICQPVNLLDAATQLKQDRAPKIGGYYVAAMPPQVSRDIMNDKAVWIPVHVYNETDQVWKGEIGRIYGVKVIEHTNAFTQDTTQGTLSATGNVYSTHVFGQGAYGVPNLASMSPFAPQVRIVKGPDKADPLDQQTLVGFKTFYAAKVLQPGWLVEILSQAGFGH